MAGARMPRAAPLLGWGGDNLNCLPSLYSDVHGRPSTGGAIFFTWARQVGPITQTPAKIRKPLPTRSRVVVWRRRRPGAAQPLFGGPIVGAADGSMPENFLVHRSSFRNLGCSALVGCSSGTSSTVFPVPKRHSC